MFFPKSTKFFLTNGHFTCEQRIRRYTLRAWYVCVHVIYLANDVPVSVFRWRKINHPLLDFGHKMKTFFMMIFFQFRAWSRIWKWDFSAKHISRGFVFFQKPAKSIWQEATMGPEKCFCMLEEVILLSNHLQLSWKISSVSSLNKWDS